MSRSPLSRLVVVVVALGVALGVALVSGGSARPRAEARSRPEVALVGNHPPSTTTNERHEIDIQAVFDARGNPSLIANFDAPAPPVSWSICRPISTCTSPRRHPPGILEPGAEPAGTVFVARTVYAGHTYSARTRWRGPVRATEPPRLRGATRYRARVASLAAKWTGGWGDEGDQLAIEACRRPAHGGHCVMVTGGELGCPPALEPTRVGRRYTGWYLFAVDARLPRDSVCAGTAYRFNTDLPVWRTGRTVVRSAPVGPVVGPPR